MWQPTPIFVKLFNKGRAFVAAVQLPNDDAALTSNFDESDEIRSNMRGTKAKGPSGLAFAGFPRGEPTKPLNDQPRGIHAGIDAQQMVGHRG